MSWLQACGAKIGPLSVKNVELDGKLQYGVFADGEIEPHGEVAQIPLSCSISIASALQHPDLQEIWEKNPQLSEGRSPMAVQLLWERHLGEKSKLSKWIEMLPRQLDLPMMWSREDRQHLIGTSTLDRVLADIDGLVEDYENVFTNGLFKLHPDLFPVDSFTLEDYMWAWAIIWSRDIEQKIAGVWDAFLVPFVDMMNHAAEGGAHIYVNFAKTDVIVRLNGTLLPGQELRRAYIPLAPNFELFRMYGFIDPVNPHVVSTLDFAVNREEAYFERRVNWARRYKLDIETSYPYNSLYITNRGIPPNIPAILRIAYFNFEGRDTWTSIKDAPDPFKRVDNQLEESFFSFLRDKFTYRLDNAPTTEEEDQALLQRTDLSLREQLAIEMRLEEKTVLQGALDSLATTIVRFDEPINLNREKKILYPKRAASRGLDNHN